MESPAGKSPETPGHTPKMLDEMWGHWDPHRDGTQDPQPVKVTSSLCSPGLPAAGGQRFHHLLEPLHGPRALEVP